MESPQLKIQPADLHAYATQDASLRKLPDTRIIKEGDRDFFEFSFSNGFKVVTNCFEEGVKFGEGDERRYFRIRKFVVNFDGDDVDLLDNELAKLCDHYMSFRVSSLGSHSNREVVVVDNEGNEVERYKSSVVLYAPENEQRTDYDGEEMLYHWVHEFGHVLGLVGVVRKYRKVNNGNAQYERMGEEKLDYAKKRETPMQLV